ncbi:hypothetical protein H9I32_28445 [Bacillus sp. Xin]|nr:hypothetical protein [Bacillus sp. Xin]NSW37335.1 hypothetical protein [Bacillus sp. Xin1]
MLVKRLGGTKGRDHGDTRTKIWTDAHEQNSLGVDKEMDLQNNHFGRATAYDNYSWSNDQYSNYLRESVSKGDLVRIVNEQLVATTDVTGK